MRKQKVRGLVLLAPLVIVAIAASLGHAEEEVGPEFKFASNPTSFDWSKLPDKMGKNEQINKLTVAGDIIECKEAIFTTQPIAANNAESIKVTPVYGNCETAKGKPVTVSHNQCWYRLFVTQKKGEGHYQGPFNVECPAGQAFEVLIFYAEELEPDCIVKISEQKGLKEVTYTEKDAEEEVEEAALSIIVEGTVGGISFVAEGSGCVKKGPGTTGIRHLHMKVKGTDAEGNPSNIYIE